MQVEHITKLLALQNSLYDYQDQKAIIDFIVNDTYKIIQYQIAVVVERSPNNSSQLNVLAVSGTIDTKDQQISKSFKNWLNKTSKNLVNLAYQENTVNTGKKPATVVIIHPPDLTTYKEEWAENLGQEIIVAKLYANQKNQHEIFLILFNDTVYPEADVINLNLIIKAYNQSLTLSLKDDPEHKNKSSSDLKTKILAGVAIIVVLSLIIPITPTVMAPAQILSEKTWLINSPVTGVVKKVEIEPNTTAQKNQLLLSFDKLDLNNTLKLKEQEQKSLEAELNQAQALGFEDKEQRGKTFRLQQDILAKKQEIYYASQQLELSDVTAPEQGVVLFKSKDDLLGKPVRTGETLMKIADKNLQQLEIWLSINDNINLRKGMTLYYYSNKSPFTAIKAELDYYSYEAYVTPQKKIAYRLVAKFKDPRYFKNNQLIIGDQGQAKLYALQKTSLARYMLQKPLAKLRQWYYGVS